MHGGPSLSGKAHPNYKHGRYARWGNALPERLAARYVEAARDRELLNLTEDIALTDARIADLLSRVDSGESGSLWTALRRAKDELLAARQQNNTIRLNLAMGQLIELIDKGFADSMAWREIGEQLDRRCKMAEAEHRRMQSKHYTLSVTEAMAWMDYMLAAVKNHVSDRQELNAVQAEFESLVNRGVKMSDGRD